MSSVRDDRGYNQGFKPSKTVEVRTRRRSRYILAEMDLSKPNEVLEIGCGLGELSALLAEHANNHVLGTDLCVPFIEEARQMYTLRNLEFQVLDFTRPESLGPRRFDYIVGNGILHHLYHGLGAALRNLMDLLNEGGKILFLEPNLLNAYCYAIFTFPFLRRLARLEPAEMAFTKRFIERILAESGFRDTKVEYRDFLVPIIPSALILPTVLVGDVLEKIPMVRMMSQSLFIRGSK